MTYCKTVEVESVLYVVQNLLTGAFFVMCPEMATFHNLKKIIMLRYPHLLFTKAIASSTNK